MLLVDDFYDISSNMLHTAYIEAIYHADDFLYEKLTQQFWFDVLKKLSTVGLHASDLLTKYFPMKAEDHTFARPAILGFGQKEMDVKYRNKGGVNTCIREDLNYEKGKCKRFPTKTC